MGDLRHLAGLLRLSATKIDISSAFVTRRKLAVITFFVGLRSVFAFVGAVGVGLVLDWGLVVFAVLCVVLHVWALALPGG